MINVTFRQRTLAENPLTRSAPDRLDAGEKNGSAPTRFTRKSHKMRERPCQRVLIVGTDETAQRLAAELERHFPGEFFVLGWVADNNAEAGAPEEDFKPAPRVVGTREELSDLVRRYRVDRVMFANCVDWQLESSSFQRRTSDRRAQRPAGRNALRPDEKDEKDAPSQGRHERRREVADLYSWATSASFFWPDARRAKLYRACKRAFDIAFSLGALILTAPLAAIILPAIKFTSAGPIFYEQERVGLGGESFTIYKLRTMRVDAESASGPMIAPKNDDRGTPIGRILRATKLDEFPQFWNVLRGQMSIVGPRPERPHFVEPFSGHIYSYSLRHSVRPGLTGLAQIKGDHLTHVYVKLHYDLIYVCQRNFLVDLKILAKTPLTILQNMMRRS